MFVASNRRRGGALRERVQQMRLNSKLTWGLAWTGLAIVVAVPSADFLTGQAGGKTAAVLTSTTEPVVDRPVTPPPTASARTASVTTTVTPNGIKITPAGSAGGADPVNDYLKANKALPDYISGGGAPASVAPTQVATVEPTPTVVAPVPFPSRPPDIVTPVRSATTGPTELPPPDDVSTPFVVDDDPQLDQATVEPAGPVPPEPIGDEPRSWRGMTLEQYLDRNGLVDDGSTRSTATVTVTDRSDPNYDPDGFYLSDGPNGQGAYPRRPQRQAPPDDGWNLPDFTLF